jgi:hypothetical protein
MKPCNGEIKPYALLLEEQARRAENEERLKARGRRIGGWGLVLLVIALLIAGASSGCASDLDDADRASAFEARGPEIAAAVWAKLGAPGPMPKVTYVHGDCNYRGFMEAGKCIGGIYNPEDHSLKVTFAGAYQDLGHELGHAHLSLVDPDGYEATEGGHRAAWWWDLVYQATRATEEEIWR